MKIRSVTGFGLLVASAAFGSIIPIDAVPNSGAGLGSVNTVLTIQGGSTASGCVSGAAGNDEGFVCPPGIPGGAETGGEAGTNVYNPGGLGLTTFGDLEIIFNAIEPNNNQRSVTVSQLALTLWGTNGEFLGDFFLEAPYVVADPEPGFGNAGFGFILDDAQAAQADLILAANPDLRIGLAATVQNAQAGPETFSIRVNENGGGGGSEVPEPGTYALAASAFAGFLMLRKLRNS